MSTLVNFAARGAQIVFAAVVLGLSVDLIKGQVYDNTLPATLGYAAFVGGISLLGAFVGLAATWIELLQGIIGAGIDVLIILFNLAGGIVIAVKLKGINCSSSSDEQHAKMYLNELINGGCVKRSKDKVPLCGYGLDGDIGKLNARCKENSADSAFMFLTIVVLLVAVTMMFLHRRK